MPFMKQEKDFGFKWRLSTYDNGYYIEIQQGIRSYLDIVDINTAGWIKAIPLPLI